MLIGGLTISDWRAITVKTAIPLIFGVIVMALASLMIGSQFYGPNVLIETLQGQGDSATRTIIWSLRFPRMIMAFEVGAALALAGLALQSLLKNPLVEPYLIGASSGAAFGATLVLVFMPVLAAIFAVEIESMSAVAGSRSLISIAAFLGSLGAISFIYISSYKRGDFSTKRLILMGVVLGAFLSAFVALMIIASGESIRQVVWWLMGSLEIGPRNGWVILGVVLAISWVYLFTKSYKLNLLSQGEETAQGLGVRVKSLKREILVAAAILTAVAVSMSGIIGFVGLIVPHFFRMVHGPDNRILIPITGLGGGLLLMIADLLAQNILPVGEIPVGIITTILGAPFFWFVLRTPAGER